MNSATGHTMYTTFFQRSVNILNKETNYIGAKLESEGLITRRPVSKGRYGRTQIFHLEEEAFTVKNIVREVLAERFNIKP